MTTEATRQLKPTTLRNLIAESVRQHVSAYRVVEVCDVLGILKRGEGEEGDPWNSKVSFVENRLLAADMAQLLRVARRVLQEWDDPELEAAVGGRSARGVDGDALNLIFAADGPKPEIVLVDAINNIVRMTKNAQNCLVYDRPLDADGLSWNQLVDWWVEKTAPPGKIPDRLSASRNLWQRLAKSLASAPEKQLFREYCARYAHNPDLTFPALLPQVYLHYDPYSHLGRPTLHRQRMDFLLLLPNRVRVVVEIDGKHHYAQGERADSHRYADMVREDRRLRLAGYEVYRFGGQEFVDENEGSNALIKFFDELLTIHLGEDAIKAASGAG